MKKSLAWWTRPCRWQTRYNGPFLLLSPLSLIAAPQVNVQLECNFFFLWAVKQLVHYLWRIMSFSLKILRYTIVVKNVSSKMQAGVKLREYIGQFCFFLIQIQVSQWEYYSRGVNWTNRSKLIPIDINGYINGHQAQLWKPSGNLWHPRFPSYYLQIRNCKPRLSVSIPAQSCSNLTVKL